MKKSFSISMILLLLVSITGVTVNTHYCHGAARYTAVAVDADHASCCGDDMDRCPSCEDRVSSKVLDVQTVFVASFDQHQLNAAPVMLPVAFDSEPAPVQPVLALRPISHGPPGLPPGSAIPILIQSFLN
ncbi:hypothetical protein KQI65_16885 [bacterium]|nr:hypothetical protein [bacterium]